MKRWVDAQGFANVQLEALREVRELVSDLAVRDGLAFYDAEKNNWHGTLKRMAGDQRGKRFVFSERLPKLGLIDTETRLDGARYLTAERAFEGHGYRIAPGRRVIVLRDVFGEVAS